MRLITWNVHKRTRGIANHVDVIAAKNADIVALQEVKPGAATYFRNGLATHGLVHSLDAVGTQNHGVLLASRWPLETLYFLDLPRPESSVSALVHSPYGPIELHAVHVPNGSSGLQTKIVTFDRLYEALAHNRTGHRILCGDFNSPYLEESEERMVVYGARINSRGEIVVRIASDKGAQARAEWQVMRGLACFDLRDTYWQTNPTGPVVYSWYARSLDRCGHRLDHIFASASLRVTECNYIHAWRRDLRLSDHAAVEAVFAPTVSP